MVVGVTVGKQSVRQLARRAALDAQAKMRAERVDQERRLSALGVRVMVALSERDQLVTLCEERAASALAAMVEREGLSLGEAVVWCGPDLSRSEAVRLRRLRKVGAAVGEPNEDANEGEPVEGSAASVAPEPTGPRASGRSPATGSE